MHLAVARPALSGHSPFPLHHITYVVSQAHLVPNTDLGTQGGDRKRALSSNIIPLEGTPGTTEEEPWGTGLVGATSNSPGPRVATTLTNASPLALRLNNTDDTYGHRMGRVARSPGAGMLENKDPSSQCPRLSRYMQVPT